MAEDAASDEGQESRGEKRPAEEPLEAGNKKLSKIAEQKRTLGATFGTRKARKRQANRDSNVIDTSNLDNIMYSLVESINENAKAVPDQALIDAKQEELRPVPKYNLHAETPAEVYKLENIILPENHEAMKSHISALKKATDNSSRIDMLAVRRSNYLNDRLLRLYDVSDGQKFDSSRARIIYFASVLMGFYLNRRGLADREKLALRLGNPPSVLLDSVMARFSENNAVDNRNADKLLTHLFVLGLHLDNFASDLKALQEDLQLRPPQIASLYKELGCTVGPITEAQRLALALPKSETKALRRAVLKVPLTFPPPKRGGPVKR